MDFLPLPHEIHYGEGVFQLRFYSCIALENTEPGAFLYAQMLKEAILRHAGMETGILRGRTMNCDIVLCMDEALAENTYHLSVREDGVRLSAGSDESLLHGVQTLIQHIQRHGQRLPAVEIRDWPDLPNRGYYQDCSRGRVPTLASLKKTADLLCSLKINEWQLYIEHTYLFRTMSEIWREDTPLTAQDIMELDLYCRARHIELVPSLSSFGHMYRILSTKSFCRLCELEDSEKQPFTYTYWAQHHTLNVSHPDAMDFIKGMIMEYRALFTSRKFNICCDETYDLGKGRSKALAEERGTQELYVSHVSELCRWLLEQGVTPQFWGDIMWRHPESYDRIPKGAVCLNWAYLPDQREDEVRILAQMGATQYVCSGIWSWNHWIPLLRDGFDNIRRMCAHGHKYGAIGLLNTDWGDFGHICSPVLSIPGIAYGAAFAWNSAEQDFEEINRAASFLLFSDRSGDFVSALAEASLQEAFDWGWAVRWLEAEDPEKRSAYFRHARISEAAACNERLIELHERFNRCLMQMDADKRPMMQAVTLAVLGMFLFNQVAIYIAANFEGFDMEYRCGATLAADLEHWFTAYKDEWRKTSRQSRLDQLQKVICGFADLLREK